MSDDRPIPDPGERSNAGGQAAADDSGLGAALGRAIGGRVESAGARPMPAATAIADLAAARARARVARRTVVGLAASVALVVGGVLAWNALNTESTSEVLVVAAERGSQSPDQSVDEVPESPGTGVAGEASIPEDEGALESQNAGGDETPVETASDDNEPDGAAGEDDEPAASDTVTPEQLSTGPVLQWTEIDPGFIDLFMLESVGDGRVVARAFDNVGESGTVMAVGRVVVTADGTSWTELSMPDGVNPDHVDVSGDRWLVAGRGSGSEQSGDAPARAFFSDDEGTTWTELDLSPPPDPAPASPWLLDNLVENLVVTSALVSGNNIVLVMAVHQDLDLEALVADRGLVPEGKRAALMGWEGTDTVMFMLLDSDAQSTAALFVADAFDASVPDEDILKLSYDELGLTEEERAVLEPPGDNSVRLLWSDGSALEQVGQYGGWSAPGAATSEGFVVGVLGLTGVTVVTSPDGLVWSEAPSPADGSGEFVASGDTIWRAVSGVYGSFSVERGTLSQAPTTVATIEGLQSGVLAAGPAGLVAAAFPVPGDLPQIANGMPEGRVAKDGYELRYNEPEGGITLWDVSEDAAVYVFGPEVVASETEPEGVREVDDGQSFAVVFEDPETGADLVTFTDEDLAPIFGMSVAELEAAAGGGFETPEPWVGWSADGADWGWQTMVDAFGITDGEPWAELAVGQDFVIARVEAWQVPDSGSISDGQSATFEVTNDAAPRWFLARVP